MPTEKPLTKLEKELLLDLAEVEELFLEGKLKGGTIRSHAMYKMATRRGKTLPAPVAGKVKADHVFVGTFTRTVNRLISKKLVYKRSVKGDFDGLPYQWGYARHGKKDKDVFLTDAGKEVVETLLNEQQKADEPKALPLPPALPPMPPVRYVYAPPCKANKKVTGRHTVPMGPHDVTYIYLKET